MENQLNCLRGAIRALEELDKAVAPSSQPKDVADKMDSLFQQLQALNDSGSDIYVPVPLEALKYLDSNSEGTSNPWHYVHKEVEAAHGQAAVVASREHYLKELESEVAKMTEDSYTGSS